MKVKILLMPLLLVATVALIIWLVYPAYTNGVDGLVEKNKTLDEEEAKLKALNDKAANMERLATQLENLPSKDVLYNFLPELGMEEKMIDSLNFSSSSAGVALYLLNITQPAKVSAKENTADVAVISLPKAQNMLTEAGLAGSYEKIKEFALAIEKYKRHSDFTIFKIARNTDPSQASSNVLTSNFKFNYQKLDKVQLSEKNIDVEVKNTLDSSIIDEIIAQRDAAMLELVADQKGKANPFAL